MSDESKIEFLEARLKDAEREFLARKEAAESNFYSHLNRLRDSLPPEAKKELDDAERLFREEIEQGTSLFYQDLEQIRTIELGP